MLRVGLARRHGTDAEMHLDARVDEAAAAWRAPSSPAVIINESSR